MATRIVYISVRLKISNPGVNEITDEKIDQIIQEIDYEFKDIDGLHIESEIWGEIDNPDQGYSNQKGTKT